MDDPDGQWESANYGDDDLPEVTASKMGDYVVRGSMGKDFLYSACSLEEASNIEYTTLLPGGFEEDQEDEVDDLV